MNTLKTDMRGIRVLMIGPGEGIGGGITNLIDNFLPILKERIFLLYLPSVKQRELKKSGKLSIQNLLIAISQYVRFLIALVRFQPNIIHLHTSQGIAWLKDTFYILIGKALRCQIVLHMHGGNFDKIYDEYPPLIRVYTKWVLDLADVIVSVSTEWRKRLARLVQINRIFVFNNCIDIQAIQPNSSHSESKKITVLFLGRIGLQKGAFDLVEAIHHIPQDKMNLQIWLAGPEERDGDRLNLYKDLEKYQLTDICTLPGLVDRRKVIQLFQEADIFVLPSYYEGLPIVVLEALAAGLPIIATTVGGIPEVVKDGYNGFLVTPGDIDALAEKLTLLANDPNLCEVMGRRSREIAERDLDVNHYVGRLVQLYESMVDL